MKYSLFLMALVAVVALSQNGVDGKKKVIFYPGTQSFCGNYKVQKCVFKGKSPRRQDCGCVNEKQMLNQDEMQFDSLDIIHPERNMDRERLWERNREKSAEKGCQPGEYYSTCHSSCEKTCMQPNPEICISMCKQGCGCIRGFVRDKTTGLCTHPTYCPERFPWRKESLRRL